MKCYTGAIARALAPKKKKQNGLIRCTNVITIHIEQLLTQNVRAAANDSVKESNQWRCQPSGDMICCRPPSCA